MRDSTRLRVQEASHGLAFVPNQLARSLRTQSSMFIGVVAPDVGIAFYASALKKGAQDLFEHAGYQVLVMNTERDPARESASLHTLRAHQVDGLLLATSGGFVPPSGVPVVFFDHLLEHAGAGTVAPANRAGVELLVDHLVEHGHERLGYVGARPGLTSSSERLAGFGAALHRHGLDAPPERVRFGDVLWSEASGARAADELLALPDPPTAIVAGSDTLALGVLRALRRAGRRVPEDVALVSFDDPASGDLLDPPMTALSSHALELGERAAAMLVDVLAGHGGARPASVRARRRIRSSPATRTSASSSRRGRAARLFALHHERLPFARAVTHTFPLEQAAMATALRPEGSMKW